MSELLVEKPSRVAGILNRFIKGALWGFVAFVHFALVTVLILRFGLNCFPHSLVAQMACLPGPGPEQCPETCRAGTDLWFYILLGATGVAGVLLPLGFGMYWAVKKPSA